MHFDRIKTVPGTRHNHRHQNGIIQTADLSKDDTGNAKRIMINKRVSFPV